MTASAFRDYLTVCGAALVTIGCFKVSFALGLIFAGIAMAAIATVWSLSRDS